LVKGDHNDLRSTKLKETILKFLIELNVGKPKERISIFKHRRGNSEQRDESERNDEKIDKTPYCFVPTHFLVDKDALGTN
jgi:hypothetical protein